MTLWRITGFALALYEYSCAAKAEADNCCVHAKEAVIIGGLDMQAQAKALAQRPHVVVATPGRLRVPANTLLIFVTICS